VKLSKIVTLDEAYLEKSKGPWKRGKKVVTRSPWTGSPKSIKDLHAVELSEAIRRKAEQHGVKVPKMQGWNRQRMENFHENIGKSIKKGLVPVKGHMAAGHFVVPHFRKKTWIVTFADGDKARVSGRTSKEAAQNAKQYSRLAPVKVAEETEPKEHPGTRIFRTEDIKQ
jgi:hypothetical protein